MSEPEPQNSWKEKYLVLLEELELREKKEQLRVDLLRKALVRVSLAADGQHQSLDESLADLRHALRSESDVLQLESRISMLEELIKDLDTERHEQKDNVQELVTGSLDRVLELNLPRALKSKIRDVKKKLPKLIDDRHQVQAWQQFLQIDQALAEHILELQSTGGSSGGVFSRLFSSRQAAVTESQDDISTLIEPSPAEVILGPELERAEPLIRSLEAYDASKLGEETTEVVAKVTRDVILPSLEASIGDVQHTDDSIRQRIASVLRNLLEQIELSDHLKQRKHALIERVQMPFEWGQLPDFLHETAELVASTRMMAQREFEGFLLTLHARLHDIQDFLEAARKGEEQSQYNQALLDEGVRSELKEIRDSVAGSSDVWQIKLDIEAMVTRIVSVVDEFHRVEQQRRVEVYNRMEDLNKRMESMESEATTLKSSLEASRMQAFKDSLTELPNRQAYDDQIEREYSRWKRHGHPLALAVVDVDYFKKINDTLGHLRGDKVLKLVSREMRRCVRGEDFVARYGGEEFAIVMPDTGKAAALAAMEKVRASIEECPFNFANQRVPITCSVGVAAFRAGDTVESCFDRADKALYAAKENGRNRVEEEA